MSAANLASLKTKIEQLKHAILKPEPGDDMGAYIVEIFKVAEDGSVFCYCEDCLIGDQDPFDASLKFIDRENGEYLLIHGKASLQASYIPPRSSEPSGKGSVFKVQINTAQYFEREDFLDAADYKRMAIWKLKQGWTTLRKAI